MPVVLTTGSKISDNNLNHGSYRSEDEFVAVYDTLPADENRESGTSTSLRGEKKNSWNYVLLTKIVYPKCYVLGNEFHKGEKAFETELK